MHTNPTTVSSLSHLSCSIFPRFAVKFSHNWIGSTMDDIGAADADLLVSAQDYQKLERAHIKVSSFNFQWKYVSCK